MTFARLFMPALLLAACTLQAQEPPPGPQGGRMERKDGRFLARLQQMRVSRLQEALGLSEDKARQLAERWSRWDREHMEAIRQQGELRARFEAVLRGPEPEDDKNARVKPLLEQFFAQRRAMDEGRRRFEEDFRNGLTPAQQARLVLFMEEFHTRLREGIREHVGDRRR